MIEQQQLQAICSLPIETVAARLGLKVDRHKALCPFHNDSHPSLSFNTQNNRFKCFVCGESGGVIDLAMKVLGTGFRDTCAWLADGGNMTLTEPTVRTAQKEKKALEFDAARYARFFVNPVTNSASQEFLFDERHISPKVVKACRLASWKNWLQIPYFDTGNNLIGVQWRNLESRKCAESAEPRFRFPYGSKCHIYNLPVLNTLCQGDELYIAEGCSDCWALLSSGHKAIAIPSASLLKPDDMKPVILLAASLSLSLHMYPDADAPGERLFSQLKELIEKSSADTSRTLTLIRHQLPAGCKDYSEAYLAAGTKTTIA